MSERTTQPTGDRFVDPVLERYRRLTQAVDDPLAHQTALATALARGLRSMDGRLSDLAGG
jgi:hypothetical protein